MTVIATPDLDALVLEALRATGLGATVRVTMPEYPAEELPLVLARQVPGGDAGRLGTVTGVVDVQALASTRREASDLARQVVSALQSACLDRFAGPAGYLNRFLGGSPPTELRTGEPMPGPTLFRFQTTCRVTARANL